MPDEVVGGSSPRTDMSENFRVPWPSRGGSPKIGRYDGPVADGARFAELDSILDQMDQRLRAIGAFNERNTKIDAQFAEIQEKLDVLGGYINQTADMVQQHVHDPDAHQNP